MNIIRRSKKVENKFILFEEKKNEIKKLEIFFNCLKVHHTESQSENGFYSLTVYDTAGLEKLASIPGKYINSHGFVLVYSVTDRQS